MQETTPRIALRPDGIAIERLDVPYREVADYLNSLPEAERHEALIRSIRVGVFCLQHAVTVQDTEFVRREIDRVLRELETRTKEVVPGVVRDLVGKLGTGPGQVLAPIAQVVKYAEQAIKERVEDIRRRLDPSNADSDLSRALTGVRAMLDPERKGSIQDVLTRAVEQVTAKDGSLAAHVKTQVSDAIKPLKEEIDRLTKQLLAKEAVEEALAVTTVKGRTYEEEVVDVLRAWFGHGGATIEHVGGDNQPGDVVVTIPPEGLVGQALRIVVEARDRDDGYGHKRVSEDLEKAMRQRAASGAVYVSRKPTGLAAEIGNWGEGRVVTGPYVATVHEYLPVAVRWVAAQLRLEVVRASVATVDVGAVEPQLQRVRTALKRLTTIQGQVTSGRSALDTISRETDALRSEVQDALRQIEDALRLGVKPDAEEAVG
ncbi:MAG TPA: hypothetical protein VFE42_16780 [Chloroflexota bacterium]|jgi:hypothetical protein|nr:hypothetical protein [Chloroflexota bacterium]